MKKINVSLVLMIVLCASMSLATAQTARAEAQYTLRMHVNQPVADTSYHYIYAKVLAEKVAAKTDGRVKFDIYPGSQLGSDPEVLQQVAAGAIQTASMAFANMVNIYEPMNIFALPFLFDDFQGASRALNGPTAAKIYQGFEEASAVKILGIYNGGVRGFTNSKKPIKSVEDFAGLKIRVPGNPILVQLVKVLGANAITMSGNEIFTALQQNTVDGQESANSWSYDQGYAEVQKHLTITNHGYTATSFLINAAYFNALPKDIQKALEESAKEAAIYIDGFCEMYDLAVIGKYQAAGLEVTKLDTAQFRPRVQIIWSDLASKIGGMEVINNLVKDGQSKVK